MAKKAELLQAAQEKVREGGYNNFSFRELAKDVGIKSASVHYHFPTKADLGAELARQYTDNFIGALGEPDNIVAQGQHPANVYIQHFRQALNQDKKMCLCGLLGAESDVLPDKVKDETKRFFRKNLEWLIQAYQVADSSDSHTAKAKAAKMLSLLEGAMMVAITMDDIELFELAVNCR